MRWLPATLAGAIIASGVDVALGQSTTVLIRDPLPTELKERTTELLRTVRPHDADAALTNTKIIHRGWREDGLLFLRIEADCPAGLCMTMLAHVMDHAIVPEVTLAAGRAVLVNDFSYPLWGLDTWSSIVFEGLRGSGTVVTRRGGAWVFGACGDCFPSSASEADTLMFGQAPPKQADPTFDDFRRAIDQFGRTGEQKLGR